MTNSLKPYSMFAITAKLITHVDKAVHEAFPASASQFVQQGIDAFGQEKVKAIAEQATREEEHHILNKYLAPEVTASESLTSQHTIYALMAKLFAEIAKPFVDTFGEKGKDAVREGVRTFGESRGRGIAGRAEIKGYTNSMEHYLSSYDMERSELFEVETIFHENEIEQTFTKCPFGQQWADDGTGEYGILYCQMIDPAIAAGYNQDFEVEHDEYVLKEGQCHFRFKMPEKERND
ncbi:L-2-amino-thiazoline-4-carboxylic acid hydrolase [Alkalicoccus daliensis]|uniref:L-2-amino-thiazoline-4-carboxylic acid hydrolase n=1 Tax=Alkalicoccus daliensis TaxID=745820 RepID=A0A1H0ISV5_9BACI|nr:L-2-amino-thiazoline-4-carboxylic acid hydrolase [Alkalicoccus daliensis]SDO34360.1 L-2-amino-thiazoline-4-carboxylic acid hydrolase [Alkalicoccus daliensis]